jgi:hypothetical protein
MRVPDFWPASRPPRRGVPGEVADEEGRPIRVPVVGLELEGRVPDLGASWAVDLQCPSRYLPRRTGPRRAGLGGRCSGRRGPRTASCPWSREETRTQTQHLGSDVIGHCRPGGRFQAAGVSGENAVRERGWCSAGSRESGPLLVRPRISPRSDGRGPGQRAGEQGPASRHNPISAAMPAPTTLLRPLVTRPGWHAWERVAQLRASSGLHPGEGPQRRALDSGRLQRLTR